MSEIKRVTIISGSPKAPGKAASDHLAAIAAHSIGNDAVQVQVFNIRECLNKQTTREAYEAMAKSDAMMIVFPLYVFCLPGITMRFLQDYLPYAKAHPAGQKQMVYSVVNCGFPEPEINEEASRVVGRFAAAIGGQYGRGVLIGSGGMVTLNVAPSQKMREQYRQAMRDIQAEIITGRVAAGNSVCLHVHFPRKLYFLSGHRGWRQQIRENGKTEQDLYARPYQPAENQ